MESTKSTFQTSSTARRIIFFDGYCTLCNWWIDFLLKRIQKLKRNSSNQVFLLASLQGKAAREIFEVAGRTDLLKLPLRSIVLYERVAGTVQESDFFTESDAVIRIISQLGFPWSMCKIFKLLPRGLRDTFYRFISKNRYQLFGKRQSCRVPTPEEREWFLD